MVFKRRTRRGFWRTLWETFFPRGGWLRAASYVWYRLRRLPDSPHRIARGIGAGVFVCFTPFFGLHFLTAAIISWVIRGNIVASLLATFFGNPLTFPLIAAVSLRLGNFILGTEALLHENRPLTRVFSDAMAELWFNIRALFTAEQAEWSNLWDFFREIFLPYLVGGLVPGLLVALAFYALSLQVIEAYQHRRRGRIRAKFEELRRRRQQRLDDGDGS